VVICEAKSFVGGGPRLDQLDGVSNASLKPQFPRSENDANKCMQVARLANPQGQFAMQVFARRHPHDWSADIGSVPPRRGFREAILEEARENSGHWLGELADGEAAVYGPDPYHLELAAGKFNIRKLAACKDLRAHHGHNAGDNLCRAAVMRAIGTAGSRVNLQECVVLWRHPVGKATVRCFSHGSWGSVELFRPAAVVVSSEQAQVLVDGMLKDRNATAEDEGFFPTEVLFARPHERAANSTRTD